MLQPLVWKKIEVLDGDTREPSPEVPPSPCVRVAAPMSEVWDRKWGHPNPPVQSKGQAGLSSFTEGLCKSTMLYR